jgi:hypothetical protein
MDYVIRMLLIRLPVFPFDRRRGCASHQSAFLASLLLDDNIAPAVPFGHPFRSVRQAIENFLPFPDWGALCHHRIFHSLLCSSLRSV